MKTTGVEIYNKEYPVQPDYIAYSKPAPTTFDNILKLDTQSQKPEIGSGGASQRAPAQDTGLETHQHMELMN